MFSGIVAMKQRKNDPCKMLLQMAIKNIESKLDGVLSFYIYYSVVNIFYFSK